MKVLTYPSEEAEVLIERIVNRSFSYPAELEQTVVQIIPRPVEQFYGRSAGVPRYYSLAAQLFWG